MRFRAGAIGLFAVAAVTGCSSNGSDVAGPTLGESQGIRLGQSPTGDVRSSFQVVRGTGDITSTVLQFRGLLGEPLAIAQVVRAGRTVGQGHFVIRSAAQKSPCVWNWSKFSAIRARSLSIMYLQLLRRNAAPSRSADCLV